MFRWTVCTLMLVVAGLFVAGCDDSSARDSGSNKDRAKDGGGQVDGPGKDAVKDAGKDSGKGAAKDADKPSVAQGAEWPKPEDRQKMFMDFNMTDHDGKAYNLKQALGKPTIATFIFTRCPNPQMCPLQAQKMAWLQGKLEKAGLNDKVNLLLISFDPDYDTPERLNKFGKDAGVKFTNARMLRPKQAEFNEFIDEFPIRVGYSKTAQVNHKTDLFMLDHNGGFTRMYYGMWDDAKVLAETQRLVDEASSPSKDAEKKDSGKDAEKTDADKKAKDGNVGKPDAKTDAVQN